MRVTVTFLTLGKYIAFLQSNVTQGDRGLESIVDQ